jgi:hypothetical protein
MLRRRKKLRGKNLKNLLRPNLERKSHKNPNWSFPHPDQQGKKLRTQNNPYPRRKNPSSNGSVNSVGRRNMANPEPLDPLQTKRHLKKLVVLPHPQSGQSIGGLNLLRVISNAPPDQQDRRKQQVTLH